MSLRLVHASALLSLVTVGASAAQLANTIPVLASGQAERILQAPPRLQERARPSDRAPTARDAFEKSYDLYIRQTRGTIYNPSTAHYDTVYLRAYQQTGDQGWDARDANAASFLAPTVVMAPGQTVRFRLYNQLAPLTQAECATTDSNLPNPPGCFNVTNLHSHGLWVSPSGNSDNVLIAINPGVNFEYEYNLPIDHPAGTFWYHPHTHGSTAIQVASGMAGALVVEGDRFPTLTANGDLDVLLKKFQPAKGSAGEVMLLQQIPYACLTQGGNKIGPCNLGGKYVVDSFDQVESPSAWVNSGRYTSVNGKVLPVLDLPAQQLHRWRLVDTGFQASIGLRIRRAPDPQKLLNAITAATKGVDLVSLCGKDDDVVQYEVASDGLTHKNIIAKTLNYLQPGYRSDILFALPQTGAYCVYDDLKKNALDPDDTPRNARLIAVLRATVNPDATREPYALAPVAQRKFITEALLGALNELPPASLPDAVKDEIRPGLYNLQLARFVPHPNFSDNQILSMRDAKKEYVTFNIAQLGNQTRFMVEGEPDKTPTPDIRNVYRHDRIDHQVILGTEQIWQLGSKLGSHPFHIHVNPFQIVSITSTNPSSRNGDDIDPQYKDLVGTWKDTLLVIPGHKIEVATRYQRYIGEYVLHCHILEHEDQGMMQNVKVVLPDGDGGASRGAHGSPHDHH